MERSAGIMVTRKKNGVDPELEKSISKLLKQVMTDKEATLTDKMKVIDRALKLEQVKQKFDDASFGLGFDDEDE
jgi:hypothetical protein